MQPVECLMRNSTNLLRSLEVVNRLDDIDYVYGFLNDGQNIVHGLVRHGGFVQSPFAYGCGVDAVHRLLKFAHAEF